MPVSANRDIATIFSSPGSKLKDGMKPKGSRVPASSGKPTTLSSTSKKRKIIDIEQDELLSTSGTSVSKTTPVKNKKQKNEPQEKRLRVYRKKAPASFLQKLERAQNQRMIVIGRTRSFDNEELQEQIDIVGTTGNIYSVTVGRLLECTCPDHKKGNECKHKVYALHNVLKAPYELQYQRALLSTEVEQIFDHAPSMPSVTGDSSDKDGKRKPIDGECPICYMDMEADSDLVWCKAACGNNIHKSCFDQWAVSQKGKEVRCVYCREPWEMEQQDLTAIKEAGKQTEEGYINVAEQFGMSRVRDYSSYYQPWARRNFGYG